MSTNTIHDLYDGKTHYMIGGSKEFFRLSLFNAITKQPIDLTSVNNIEWLLGTYSVRERNAIVEKSLRDSDIQILRDANGNYTNTIQVSLNSEDTKDLQGGFVHQIFLTDGSNETFIPFQGLIIIDRGLKRT